MDSSLSTSEISIIRESVFRTLSHLSHALPNQPIEVKRLFLLSAEELVEKRLFIRPDIIRGQEYGKLINQPEDSYFPDYGIPAVIADEIRRIIWDYYRKELISPFTRAPINTQSGYTWVYFDQFKITKTGITIIEKSDYQLCLYDPDGYLLNITNIDPTPDPEMMKYLQECLVVFHGGHLFATVVLLAIASERLIDLFGETLRNSLGEPTGAEWYSRNIIHKREVSVRFEALEAKLMGEYGKQLTERKLLEGFHNIVKLTFQSIRITRNEIAHPMGRNLTINEVTGLLHNYFQYYLHTIRIINFLQEPKK